MTMGMMMTAVAAVCRSGDDKALAERARQRLHAWQLEDAAGRIVRPTQTQTPPIGRWHCG